MEFLGILSFQRCDLRRIIGRSAYSNSICCILVILEQFGIEIVWLIAYLLRYYVHPYISQPKKCYVHDACKISSVSQTVKHFRLNIMFRTYFVSFGDYKKTIKIISFEKQKINLKIFQKVKISSNSIMSNVNVTYKSITV